MNIRYPKARSVGFTLAFWTTIALLGGCCTCRERYRPALDQWHENLTESIRPSYEKALKATGLPADLRETKLGVLDRTAQGIDRVRGAGPDAWEGGAK